jgi:hypothetical protein
MPLKLVHDTNWPTEEDKQISSIHIEPDREEGSYILVFTFGYCSKTRATIRCVLKDKQSGADMAITNMTVLPYEWCGHGFGTAALKILLKNALAQECSNIQAMQVQRQSERFWVKNGFEPLKNETNDFRYTRGSDFV